MRGFFRSRIKRNKFGNKPCEAFGIRFRSRKEREHALFLESELLAGRINGWKYELRYPLEVNGQRICIHAPDFTVVYPDKRMEIHEVKGGLATQTDTWRLKKKLFEVLYPHISYRVFEGKSKLQAVLCD